MILGNKNKTVSVSAWSNPFTFICTCWTFIRSLFIIIKNLSAVFLEGHVRFPLIPKQPSEPNLDALYQTVALRDHAIITTVLFIV